MSCGNVSMKIVSELPDHHCHRLFRQDNTQPIVVGDGRFTCSKENVKKHIEVFGGEPSLGEEPQEGWCFSKKLVDIQVMVMEEDEADEPRTCVQLEGYELINPW